MATEAGVPGADEQGAAGVSSALAHPAPRPPHPPPHPPHLPCAQNKDLTAPEFALGSQKGNGQICESSSSLQPLDLMRACQERTWMEEAKDNVKLFLVEGLAEFLGSP